MENSEKQRSQEYLTVLQKFINNILFGSFSNPKFSKDVNEISLAPTLISFFQSLKGKDGEERNKTIMDFYELSTKKFRRKLNHSSLIDLMNCYGFSKFHLLSNLYRTLGAKNMEYNAAENDEKILFSLILSKDFPEDIKAYLSLQFFDLFIHLPSTATTINQEEYKALIDRYVCEYPHDKAVSIICQNYEYID